MWDHRAPRFSLGSVGLASRCLTKFKDHWQKGAPDEPPGPENSLLLGVGTDHRISGEFFSKLLCSCHFQRMSDILQSWFRMFLLLMVFGILASLAPRGPVSAMAEHGSCISNRTLFTYLNRVNESSWNETCGAWYFVYFMFHVFSHVSTDIGHWLHLRGCSVQHGSHKVLVFVLPRIIDYQWLMLAAQ